MSPKHCKYFAMGAKSISSTTVFSEIITGPSTLLLWTEYMCPPKNSFVGILIPCMMVSEIEA